MMAGMSRKLVIIGEVIEKGKKTEYDEKTSKKIDNPKNPEEKPV